MSSGEATATGPATSEGLRELLARRLPGLIVALQLVALGFFPAPMVLLRDPVTGANPVVHQFFEELAFWFIGGAVIVVPVIVCANVFGRLFDETWANAQARLDALGDHWFVGPAVLAAVGLSAAAAMYVFARKPTSSDEIAQLWHARILLSGRLSLPADPNPEFFAIDNVVDHGRWYSQFPIGGPAFLALAMAVRLTWLLNPLLAGLTVLNAYRFALRAYGRDEARVIAVLAAACPYLLLISGSYMNHTLVVWLTTLALANLPVWLDGSGRERRRASLTIGLALGTAVTVRPLDAAVAAVVFGAVLLRRAVSDRRLEAVVRTVVAAAVPVVALLLVNQATNGSPLRFGYDIIWGPNHSLGFHTDPLGTAHTPERGLRSVMAAVMQLNWSLFGWPIAGVIVVAAAVLAIGRLGRWELVLLAWIELHLAAYAAFWSEGQFLGPRYLFTVLPAFLMLAARGITVGVRRASPRVRRTLIAGLGAAMLGAWVFPSPPFGTIGEARAARPLRAALKVDLDPAVASLGGGKALIFVTEPASLRLARRLWALGLSRPDAIRLVAQRDNCALLDAAVVEARHPGAPTERLARLERTRMFALRGDTLVVAPDPAFQVSDRASISPYCWAEGMVDRTAGAGLSYGPAMLRNEIGSDGRITGPVVFVADMREHNEVLRARFGDRPWYRLRLDENSAGRAPRLVPYD